MKLESESEFLLIIMMVLWVKFFERVMQHLQCMTQVSNLPALPYTSRLVCKPTPSPYSVTMIIHLPFSRNDIYNFRNGFHQIRKPRLKKPHLQCMLQVSNLSSLPYMSQYVHKPSPSSYSVIMIIHLPFSRNNTYNFISGFH